MMKEYWFFFDKDGMPIAVFYTLCKGDAVDLFTRLYRRPWSESVKLGITMEKESDVPVERWDEIHNKYIARVEPPKPAVIPVVKPVIPPRIMLKKNECQGTGLSTEKYMSRM
jgi:hypothetical protein